MPTGKEILLDLARRVGELEQRVERLEAERDLSFEVADYELDPRLAVEPATPEMQGLRNIVESTSAGHSVLHGIAARTGGRLNDEGTFEFVDPERAKAQLPPDDKDIEAAEASGDLDPELAAAMREARRRLRNDTGGVIEQQHRKANVAVAIDSTGAQVTFPAPHPEQVEWRKQLMPDLWLFQLEGITPEDAEAAYLEGGPLWLHAFDRDYVLSLSPQVRAAMVADVQRSDPWLAHEFGRDVLMQREEEDAPSPDEVIARMRASGVA